MSPAKKKFIGAVAQRGHLLLLIAVFFYVSLFRITNNDIWWHLKTGEWILEHRTVPHHDPFSLIASGRDWIDHEWLFQTLAAILHTAWGTTALVLLRGVVAVAIAGILYTLVVTRRVPPLLATALLIFAGITLRERMFVRPEMFSLLFMALLLCILESSRNGNRWSSLWALVLGFFWGNTHAACLMGLMVGGAYLVGEFLDNRQEKEEERPKRARLNLLFISLVAFLAGTLINPYTVRLYAIPFELYGIVGQPWAQNLEWQRPPVLYFGWYYLLLALTLGVIVLRVLRGNRPSLCRILPVLGLAVASLLHLRNIGFFAVCAPLVFLGVSAGVFPTRSKAKEGWRSGLLLLGALGAMILAVNTDSLRSTGFGINTSVYPVKEVDFIERQRLQGPLFNEVGHGGYVIYRLFPQYRPFIDGRNELYPDLLEEIHEALADTTEFKALLDRYGLNFALVRYQPELTGVEYTKDGKLIRAQRAFSAVYFHRSRWALVYWDDGAMVLVRRTPETEVFIEKNEFISVHPEDWRYVRDRIGQGDIDRRQVIREIDRKLEENPECRRAQFLKRVFSKNMDVTKNGLK
ncbi:ArnT family glycosyltransferase [Acidobacteriota bacterium]